MKSTMSSLFAGVPRERNKQNEATPASAISKNAISFFLSKYYIPLHIRKVKKQILIYQ